MQTLSSDPKSGVTGFYDPNSGKVILQTTATGSAAQIQVTNDAAGLFQNVFQFSPAANMTSAAFASGALTAGGLVELNGQKISLAAGETLANVTTAINSVTSSTGVTATVNGSNQLVLSGSNLYSPISISDPSGAMQMAASPSNAAKDAMYSVNGVATSSSNNSPVFNGVTLNLQGVTGANPVMISVSSNTSAIVQSITNFVQQYNQTWQTMQGLYSQQRNVSYQPLTAAQESQMTQAQVDQWNQKAQSGMIQFDPLLGSAMNHLNMAVTKVVSGLSGSAPTTLAAIGITSINPMTGVKSGNIAPGVTTMGLSTYGMLQIDTTKLTAALQTNPQGVMSLFANSGISNGTTVVANEGLAVQMYSAVSSSISQITQEAGLSTNALPTTPNANTGMILLPSSGVDPNADLASLLTTDLSSPGYLGRQINTIDTRAQQTQKQIGAQRQMWLNQFSQMELAIQSLSTQSTAMLGVLGGSSSSGSGSGSGSGGTTGG